MRFLSDNSCNRKAISICIWVRTVQTISYGVPSHIPKIINADIEGEAGDRLEFATLLQFASHYT